MRDRAAMFCTRPIALRVAAPLAALSYPAFIWSGVQVSPIFLALALCVPALGLLAAWRLGALIEPGAPAVTPLVARWVAHLAVAAPPLFSLMGGWLDFQRAIPVHSLGAWLLLWSVLAFAAALARDGERAGAASRQRSEHDPTHLRRRRFVLVHASSATAIVLFATVHVLNHLAGIRGGDDHIAIMNVLRRAYRHPWVEPVLFVAVAVQVASGVWLLRRRLLRASSWHETLQTTTGAYLLVFLMSHVSAVLRARLLHHRDTNWTWLAGSELLADPWSARLVPYYFLAVIAIAVHCGCGLRVVMLGHGMSASRSNAAVAVLATASALVSTLILAGLFRAT
jgi:succinate dehydrogenase/fumarate reductase cytochrome b subunit